MRHVNIAVFVPHSGCPNQCSFCNQRAISGHTKQPAPQDVIDACEIAQKGGCKEAEVQLAFFGGSFTAIEREYMVSLLEAAQGYIENGFLNRGIRISTRPDFIDGEILTLLKKYGVRAIEFGAQSMDDGVLTLNKRGHTAQDVRKAAVLIKEYGFELGLQMMVGLYRSEMADEYETLERIIEIRPDTVRIYPVVILKGTRLGELYQSGEYNTFSFEDVTEFVADAMLRFADKGINVIKCGLHASEFVERDMVGGFYHPAFREICESHIYRRKMKELIRCESSCDYVFAVTPSCISKAIGQNKSNIKYFQELGLNIKIIGDENIPKYQVELR